ASDQAPKVAFMNMSWGDGRMLKLWSVHASVGFLFCYLRADLHMNVAWIIEWSWKFCPTPGRSTTVVMLAEVRSLRGPMPLSWRTCGLWIPPAATMTSFFARTTVSAALLEPTDTNETPVAVVPS